MPLELMKLGTSNVVCSLIQNNYYYCMRDIILPKGMCSESRDLLRFWKINDNISLTVQDRHIVAMEH